MNNQLAAHSFGSESGQYKLLDHLKFEIKSLAGRSISPRRRQAAKPLLHIGSGLNFLSDFENVDFYAVRFWKARHIGHDFRFPLPYENDTFDGVYSEHTLEHLPPKQAIALLKEIRRVIKPGGVFRCSVPDLQKYIRFYLNDVPSEQFNQFSSGCEAIWCLTQNWGHLSVWDFEMLSRVLRDVGFAHIVECSFRDGSDPRLLQDLDVRKWESLYIEATR